MLGRIHFPQTTTTGPTYTYFCEIYLPSNLSTTQVNDNW